MCGDGFCKGWGVKGWEMWAKGCNYASFPASAAAAVSVVVYGHYVYATCAKKAKQGLGAEKL